VSAPALLRVGPCDAVFVSAHEGEASLSCAARLDAERRRGRCTMVVALFRGPGEEAEPGAVSMGLADAASRLPGHAALPVAVFGGEAAQDECLLESRAILGEVFRRTQARQIYLPLGVGGHVDHRIAHEAGVEALPTQSGLDVFFYEERPDALVPGAVRMRLGQMGVRLPPGALKVTREGGLARLLLCSQRVPHRREPCRGLSERLTLTRLLAREWWSTRVWQPQRAFGLRLQPMVQEAPSLEAVRESARVFHARRGAAPRTLRRLLAWSGDYARLLGGRDWVERYWLMLPLREDAGRAA